MKVNFLLCVNITTYLLTTYKANNANNANLGILGFLRRKHKGSKNTPGEEGREKRVLRYQINYQHTILLQVQIQLFS